MLHVEIMGKSMVEWISNGFQWLVYDMDSITLFGLVTLGRDRTLRVCRDQSLDRLLTSTTDPDRISRPTGTKLFSISSTQNALFL